MAIAGWIEILPRKAGRGTAKRWRGPPLRVEALGTSPQTGEDHYDRFGNTITGVSR